VEYTHLEFFISMIHTVSETDDFQGTPTSFTG